MQKLPIILIERANSHFADFMEKLDSALAKDEQEAKKQARYLQLLDKHKEQVMQAFALSDFIARTAQQYPIQFMHKLPTIIEHPEHDGQQYQEYYLQLQHHLEQALATLNNEATLHAGLRQFRHLIMLSIAWRDLVYKADIKQSLLAISHLADALINSANAWLYQNACKRYGKPAPVSQAAENSAENAAPILQQQQLLVIGMGKLGGHELNFSSDIDLIFVYPGSGETDHPRKPLDHQTFLRAWRRS
jgi:glutamate-ammonia-ligase adenylyltransferase